ncbi:MAG TPA: DUF5916 domain-containing protein [Vicinamibacterales bacterium]|nr:DUF5916 domain-containing protein [Vicinamibacterales bacterium]
MIAVSEPRLTKSFCTFLFVAVLPLTTNAQIPETSTPARRTVQATRMADDERIEIDGVLDEAAWARALPAKDFIQVDPANGSPATEPTEVRIVFTKDAIYMGVTCYDSEPDKWLGYQRRRDEFLPADDRFMWTIDTFLDERSGYFFEMNPSGLMADSLFGVNGDNRAWDGIWDARVVRSEIGWTIEIEIPFRTLNFDPDNDTWGFNFQRTVRRKNEDSIWMGWARNQGLRRMTNAGHVTGIREVTQGTGLDVKPYGLVTSEFSTGPNGERSQEKANAGIDLFYNPTPGVRANLTINTDFAQTEVDQRQVNLTRFSLFFPERRDFFLDGATFFDFASDSIGGPQIQPFFSRRIGLSAEATPQKIDFGTKFTGQMGGNDVGMLQVRTGGEDGEFIPEDFLVGRIKRRLLQQSYVGAIYTRRDARTGDEIDASHTIGVDMRLATSQFRGNQNLSATAWMLHAGPPGVRSSSNAFGAGIEYPNDIWQVRLDAQEVQENFDPAVGFVLRRDYRRYRGQVYHGPRPQNHRYIRRTEYDANLEVVTDLQNQLLERLLNLTVFGVQFHSQDNFALEVDPSFVRLERPFTIVPGITMPAGSEYDFTRFAIRGQTANRRVLALNGRFETGAFYSGHRDQTVLGLTVRARPGYIVSLNGEWNQVDLAEGSFTSNVYRGTADTQFTPFMALVNILQYDTMSRVLGWQARYRWILTPGNDLYVVYTHNWVDDPLLDRFGTLDRRAASKVLYTHRF